MQIIIVFTFLLVFSLIQKAQVCPGLGPNRVLSRHRGGGPHSQMQSMKNWISVSIAFAAKLGPDLPSIRAPI